MRTFDSNAREPRPKAVPLAGSGRLARELTVLVILKCVLLLALYWAFFSPAHHTMPGSRGVATWLLATPPPIR